MDRSAWISFNTAIRVLFALFLIIMLLITVTDMNDSTEGALGKEEGVSVTPTIAP